MDAAGSKMLCLFRPSLSLIENVLSLSASLSLSHMRLIYFVVLVIYAYATVKIEILHFLSVSRSSGVTRISLMEGP